MRKIIKNTFDINSIEHIIKLLQKGYGLEDTLSLLYALNQSDLYLEMKYMLQQGNTIDSIFKHLNVDSQFLEVFLQLFPIKGLMDALNDALDLYKQKSKWLSLLKKQLSYPFLLIFVMVGFCFFIKLFLIPEIEMLLSSFNSTINSNINIYLIQFVPNLLIISSIVISSICLIVASDIRHNHKNRIHIYFKLPLISSVIQTYYSLKFAFYFSKLSCYFNSLFDTLNYFYESSSNSDLRLLLDYLVYEIEDGKDLKHVIDNCPYFKKSFKHFFYLTSISAKHFSSLDDYCTLTFDSIEKNLKKLTNVILMIIYLCTGVYVLSIYSIMIIPILEITSTL